MPDIELYKKIYLIRKSEETISEHYYEDDMKTPMHMSIGEESIVAGVCHALKKEDQVFGTHRSHALYLAKTFETDDFFAELYGKNGIAFGKCGSMHLSNVDFGFMGGSAIVGGNFAMAIGAAFANKIKKNNKIVAVFFGDGSTEEGNFWESLNIACLMKLPIIFVCEDNDLAVYTTSDKRHGYEDIVKIVENFNCIVKKSESTNPEDIYNITNNVILKIKKQNMPCFMHMRYYRYLDHVGVNESFHPSYRIKDEFYKWLDKDPIKLYREKVVNEFGENVVLEVENKIDVMIKKSVKRAQDLEFADVSVTYGDVFDE